MPTPLRVLCLVDRLEDSESMERELRLAGFDVEWERVDTEGGYLAALDRTPDVILADYTLAHFNSLLALEIRRSRNLDAPFIVVVGAVDEEHVVDCLRRGADDYLLKDRLGRLAPAVKRAIDVARERSRRRVAEEALHGSQGRFQSLVKSAMCGIYRSTLDGGFVEVNDALVRMLGYASETELRDVPLAKLYRHPSDRARLVDQHRTNHRIEGVLLEWVRKDGRPITVRLSGRALTPEEAADGGFDMIVEDVTERKLLGDQQREAQKMEALGRLAGGVAHDFNNLLTAILGFSELALRRVPVEDPIHADLMQIRSAGQSAAALTGQLLAFSHKQESQPRVLDVKEVVKTVEQMVRRVLGEDVTVLITGKGGSVQADPGQLEQIVMNLVINARDAMPRGGRMTIDVSRIRKRAPGDGVEEGDEIVLSVTDTGSGTNDAIKEHLVDPLLTTKGAGEGTGLASTYAAVTQNGGRIEVDSQAGSGTTMRIRFPAADSAVRAPRSTTAHSRRQSRAQTILLVDDEQALRAIAKRVLTAAGYQVLEASGGSEALRVAAEHSAPIHLLLTDVVMPGINGRVLLDQLRVERPGIAVVFMSGYDHDTLANRGLNEAGASFLLKPFTADALLKAVGDLGAASPSAQAPSDAAQPASRRRGPSQVASSRAGTE